MTESTKKQLVKKNTFLWFTAMLIPLIFDLGFKMFASGPVRFPWPILIPFLYIGLLLASNALITAAVDGAADPADKAEDVPS